MSARDAEMAEAIRSGSLGTSEIVAAVLSAGYSKPRTITTVEELDALPVESTIVDDVRQVWQRRPGPDKAGAHWFIPGTRGFWLSSNLATGSRLPATVLYTPKES